MTRGAVDLAVAIALCAACSARKESDTEVPVVDLGRYSFVVEAREGVRMAGTLTITRDTILAQPSGTTCRLPTEQPSSAHIVYECQVPGTSGLQLSIDRRSPLRRSTWAVVLPVRRTREVCSAWRTWENGTRSCTRKTAEEYIEQVRQTGGLVVTR